VVREVRCVFSRRLNVSNVLDSPWYEQKNWRHVYWN